MRELCAWFSRHVRNLYSACLSHEREYCASVCYGDTERAFEALLERLSSFFVVLLTCRFALCLFIVESKAVWNTKPTRRFCFRLSSCHVQINSRADYFGEWRNTEMWKSNQIEVIKNHVTIRSGSWETRSATHGWPPWFAAVKRCNLTQNSVGFPSQPNPLRGRQKDIARPLLKSPRGLVRRRKKDPTTRRIPWRSPIHVLTPPDRA